MLCLFYKQLSRIQVDNTFFQHTHPSEKKVIELMQRHLGIDASQSTGHITNGGTESNLTSLWWCEEDLKRKGCDEVIVVCSKSSHYSIKKNARIRRLKLVEIPSDDTGIIDLSTLKSALNGYTGGIIFIANIGSTETCAIDPVGDIHKILSSLPLRDFSIHLDAALMGPLIPALRKIGIIKEDYFSLPHVKSIAISGHKYLGIPMPTGLFLAFNGLNLNSEAISYLGGGHDSTIAGSRSGHTPLWWLVRCCELGIGFEHKKIETSYQSCLNNAAFLADEIGSIVGKSHVHFKPPGLQVIIPVVDKALMIQYQLMPVNRNGRLRAGIYILPNTSRGKLEQFIEDYKKAYNFKRPKQRFFKNMADGASVRRAPHPSNGSSDTANTAPTAEGPPLRSKL